MSRSGRLGGLVERIASGAVGIALFVYVVLALWWTASRVEHAVTSWSLGDHLGRPLAVLVFYAGLFAFIRVARFGATRLGALAAKSRAAERS